MVDASKELARHRCVAGSSAALRVQVLGTEESAETPLRLLRLTGLGARIRGDEHSRSIEVYLARHEALVVLALRRRVDVEDADPPSADELGRRKAGGVRLSALAAGNVVTESAVRSANRVVRIAESRVARTTVAPSGGWDELPEGLVIDDLDAEAARLAGFAPTIVRAPSFAESVRAIRVEAVEDMHFRPGAQQLVATIRAPEGRARLLATHTSAAPGAIDALARTLSGEAGAVRFVAGHVWRHGGAIDVEPTAVAAGTSVIVPAFADASSEAIATTVGIVTDRLAAEVTGALELTAGLVHRGHCRLPPGWRSVPSVPPTGCVRPDCRHRVLPSLRWPQRSARAGATSSTAGPTHTYACSSRRSRSESRWEQHECSGVRGAGRRDVL